MDFRRFAHLPRQRLETRPVGRLELEDIPPRRAGDAELAAQMSRYLPYQVSVRRGVDICPACRLEFPEQLQSRLRLGFQRAGDGRLLGRADLCIISGSDVAYMVPDLIVHYIRDHAYDPPDEFKEALELGPAPGTSLYWSQLRGFLNPLDEERILREVEMTQGWTYTIKERSPGIYAVRAIAEWGSVVEQSGEDPDYVLAEVRDAAGDITRERKLSGHQE